MLSHVATGYSAEASDREVGSKNLLVSCGSTGNRVRVLKRTERTPRLSLQLKQLESCFVDTPLARVCSGKPVAMIRRYVSFEFMELAKEVIKDCQLQAAKLQARPHTGFDVIGP